MRGGCYPPRPGCLLSGLDEQKACPLFSPPADSTIHPEGPAFNPPAPENLFGFSLFGRARQNLSIKSRSPTAVRFRFHTYSFSSMTCAEAGAGARRSIFMWGYFPLHLRLIVPAHLAHVGGDVLHGLRGGVVRVAEELPVEPGHVLGQCDRDDAGLVPDVAHGAQILVGEAR